MNTKNTQADSIGAAAISKELNISEAKVKKLIAELAIEPVAKRGVCKFYSRDAIAKIKKALPRG